MPLHVGSGRRTGWPRSLPLAMAHFNALLTLSTHASSSAKLCLRMIQDGCFAKNRQGTSFDRTLRGATNGQGTVRAVGKRKDKTRLASSPRPITKLGRTMSSSRYKYDEQFAISWVCDSRFLGG